MLLGGFMVPTPQCRVPSHSILQKPLCFSWDLALRAVLCAHTFHVRMDFVYLLKAFASDIPAKRLSLHSPAFFVAAGVAAENKYFIF